MGLSIHIKFAIAAVLMFGCFNAFLPTSVFAEDPRYAVMRYTGEVQLPAGSQIPDGDNPEKVPAESITRPALYILVADRKSNEVWQFSRMSLWNSSIGIGAERDSLYHATKEGVELNYDGNRSNQKDLKSMWLVHNTSVFAHPFGLELDSLTTLVSSISRVCQQGSLRHEPKTEANRESVFQRIPTVAGKGLILNQFQSGKIFIASWFESGSKASEFDLIASIVYMNDKPFEIRRGSLSLGLQEELPTEISNFLSRKKPASTIRQMQDQISTEGNSIVWPTLLLSASLAGFFLVVCLFLIGGQRNEMVAKM